MQPLCQHVQPPALRQALGLLAVLLLASGCGAADPRSTGPTTWREMALAAAKTAPTAHARKALSDGVVTRAEYEQSIADLVKCAADNGESVQVIDHYGIYGFSANGQAGDAAFAKCTAGNLGTVQAIYYGQYTDPDSRGQIVTSECLVKQHVLPGSYKFRSDTAFNKDMARRLDSWAGDDPRLQSYERCVYDPLDHHLKRR